MSGKAVLGAWLLACATTLGAAPLALDPEPQQQAEVETSAADAVLAPVQTEQTAEIEARAHAERTDTMLRYDFDSRGPTWMHNGAQVNPADHPARLEHNEALQEYLRGIESTGPSDRLLRAVAQGRPYADAAAEMALTMDGGAALSESRGPLQGSRSGWLAAAMVLLLMSWFAMKLLRRPPRRSRRPRHRRPDAGATSARTHHHRRRRHRSHRSHRDSVDEAGSSA